MGNLLKPFQRGFFCDDYSILYPKTASTVPTPVVAVIGVAIPVLLIFWGEYAETKRNKNTTNIVHNIGKYKITHYHWNLYRRLICCVSGGLFSFLITEVAKIEIGRLRPNFIDVCGIRWSDYCPNETYPYIGAEKFKCTNSDSDESRVSFPSGHASFSFYVAVFTVLYLEKRLKIESTILKPTIQFLVLLLAWFVALSRIMDNKHHWSDVLAGMVIGSGVALINTILVHSMFEDEKPPIIVNPDVNGNRASRVSNEIQDLL
ncbi:putative phosphatidate phosphatase [Planococcus citri]|uniref:putative phosphatidate phosphatase n=1 Tax=Planococcus citri TaxID=170843 RepID=UPI0031F78432